MAFLGLGQGSLIHIGYAGVFLLTAIACAVSLNRARRIEDEDTRKGISTLLALSGTWATLHVGFLIAPGTDLKLLFYLLGLVVGLATVGPWLYFCSAFTGRQLHRDHRLQTLAVLIFTGFTAVKLTNPVHGLYFTWEVTAQPFPHLAVRHGTTHWIAMGLAYALATVGYFMLLELFWRVDKDTRPLGLLVVVTGAPLLLDLVSMYSQAVIQMTYEPLGVAVFAVGALYIYLDSFQSLRLAAGDDDPVIILDDRDRVRDFNPKAAALVPSLETGAEFGTVAPDLADGLDRDADVIECTVADVPRYYQLSTNPFSNDRTQLGRSITLTDVTEREQYRRELERQNERLEQFASLVSHDLRNPLTVAMGRVEMELEEHESGHLAAAKSALERMETLIEDLLLLAREGESVDDPEPVQLSAISEACWEMVATESAALHVESDGTFRADPDRVNQVFENLFRNAVEHGGDAVTIRVGMLSDRSGVYVADDGPGIPDSERSAVFDYGHTSTEDGTGYGLAIVKEIVQAHGWSITVADSDEGGARFEITGLDGIE